MKYAFGHKNPDTDTVIAAIVVADYFTQIGETVEPVILWKIQNEAKFVLHYLEIPEPRLLEKLEDEDECILVDHNSAAQSVDRRKDEQIFAIIDHHALENISSSKVIYTRLEPLCSTGSILFKMYQEKNLPISKEIAVLMLAGILSDSLGFRAPTTTEEDKDIAEKLQKIAEINMEDFSMQMFQAKSDLGDISVRDLVTVDYKEFSGENFKFGYGVVETTNPGYVLGRKKEILKDLEQLKKDTNLDYVFFSIIDILHQKNTTLVSGEGEEKIIQEVFGMSIVDGISDFGSKTSRKKELVPQIKSYLEKNV